MIIHGENNLLSRQRLTNEISNFRLKTKGEVLRFIGDELVFLLLKQALEPSTLLGEKRLVVIENLFSGRKTKEKEKIMEYLKKLNPPNLLIWEGKKIDGRVLTPFRGQILRFDLTPLLFHFLDSLAPKNERLSLNLLHECLVQESPEIVFFMLTKQVKYLILAADLGKKGLGQMESWRAEKLIRQAQKFTLIKLMKIYRQLLKIEVQQKTGQTPFTLSSQLDLLVASL